MNKPIREVKIFYKMIKSIITLLKGYISFLLSLNNRARWVNISLLERSVIKSKLRWLSDKNILMFILILGFLFFILVTLDKLYIGLVQGNILNSGLSYLNWIEKMRSYAIFFEGKEIDYFYLNKLLLYFHSEGMVLEEEQNYLLVLNMVDNSNNDPSRWRPTGTPQSWGIIGSALLAYRTFQGNHRVKAIAALGALGIFSGITIYTHAIENPNGFNRVMYGLSERLRTGRWPYPDRSVNPERLRRNFHKALDAANNRRNGGNSNSFLDNSFCPLAKGDNEIQNNPLIPDGVEIISTESVNIELNKACEVTNFFGLKNLDSILDTTINFLFSLFKSVPVSGQLDELLGQQFVIYISLLILVISVLLLFIVYMINNIFLHNKEFILKYFNNKLLRMYFTYQGILAKIAIFYLPILIIIGLIVISHGLYFLITHPIPFEELGVDLKFTFNK